MKEYKLTYEYCYTHRCEEFIMASTKEEAIEKARKVLSNIGGLDSYCLIELGDAIEFDLVSKSGGK